MDDVLTEKQVAELLDCEPSTVQEKARNGILPGVKFGRSWRFPKYALLQAINQDAMRNRTPTHMPADYSLGFEVIRHEPKRTATPAPATAPRRRAPPVLSIR